MAKGSTIIIAYTDGIGGISNQTMEPISSGRNRFPIYKHPLSPFSASPPPSTPLLRISDPYTSQRWIRLNAEQRQLQNKAFSSRDLLYQILEKIQTIIFSNRTFLHMKKIKTRFYFLHDVDELITYGLMTN